MVEKTPSPACGADVLRAIRNAYPGNMVTDDLVCDEGSYHDEIRDAVRNALCCVKADLLYDRPPEGRLHWDEGADPEEDPPSWVEDPSSYDLFFLALRDEIVRVLGTFSIGVLSAQELQSPIPGLKPEPARNIVLKRTVTTVEDALFFQTV